MHGRERELKEVRSRRSHLRRLFLLGVSLRDVLISTSCSTLANADRLVSTYVVASLLILITLLVLSSLGLVGSTLLVVQCLPSLTEDLADLACKHNASARFFRGSVRKMGSYTEGDTGVLLTDIVTLLVGEEHVG